MKNLFRLFAALLFSINLHAQHVKGEILYTGTGLTIGIAENLYDGVTEKSTHSSKIKQFSTFDINVFENGKNVSDEYSYSFTIKRFKNSQSFDPDFFFSSNVFIDGTPTSTVTDGEYLIEVLKRNTAQIVYTAKLKISDGTFQIL